MTRTRLALLLSTCLALVGALLAAAPAGARSVPAAASSPGLRLVAQLPGAGGTDLEFFSRVLPRYRTASGRVVRGPALRHFAVVGNERDNARIVDITDPERPYVAAEIPCALNQGDIQVSARRDLVVLANGTGSSSARCSYTDSTTGEVLPMPPGAAIVSIRDVYDPRVIGAAPEADGAHNVSLTPDGRYLYISTSGIIETAANVPVYDLAVPAQPRKVTTFTAPGNSPHDIRFNAKGTRAYFAGISTFRIVDTTKPAAPKLISTFYPPGTTIGHDTLVTPDGAFLLAGDEAGGGSTYPCPGGAIHVFDIRVEQAPVYLGQSYAGAGPVTNRDAELTAEVGRTGGCTAHVMALNPDNRSLTLGWYGAGSRVFSFAGLYGADGKPKPAAALAYGHDGVGLVEQAWIRPEAADTWSAKQYAGRPGYIFSDDLTLGFYVTRIGKR